MKQSSRNKMKVKRIEVGQMKTNCYLVIDEISEKCLIIDPGDDADYIQRVIGDEDVMPVALIATHGHFDHVMAVTELKLAYDIPFYMSKKDEFLLERVNTSAQYFTGSNSRLPIPKVDISLESGKLKIDNWVLKVIPTPGHTPGGVSLYFYIEEFAFVGDLVFEGGYLGRYDFSYSQKDELDLSIKKVLKIPNDTKIYCGHGEATSVRELKKIIVS